MTLSLDNKLTRILIFLIPVLILILLFTFAATEDFRREYSKKRTTKKYLTYIQKSPDKILAKIADDSFKAELLTSEHIKEAFKQDNGEFTRTLISHWEKQIQFDMELLKLFRKAPLETRIHFFTTLHKSAKVPVRSRVKLLDEITYVTKVDTVTQSLGFDEYNRAEYQYSDYNSSSTGDVYERKTMEKLPLPIEKSVSELIAEAQSLSVEGEDVNVEYEYDEEYLHLFRYIVTTQDDSLIVALIPILKEKFASDYHNYQSYFNYNSKHLNAYFEHRPLLRTHMKGFGAEIKSAILHNRAIDPKLLPSKREMKIDLLDYIMAEGSYTSLASVLQSGKIKLKKSSWIMDDIINSPSPRIFEACLENGLALSDSVSKYHTAEEYFQPNFRWKPQYYIAFEGKRTDWPEQFYQIALTGNVNSSIEELKTVDKVGRNALHVAAMFSSEESINSILSKSPDLLTSSDSSGNTAISYAAIQGNIDVVELLIQKNCPIPNSLPEVLKVLKDNYDSNYNTREEDELYLLFREISRMIFHAKKPA